MEAQSFKITLPFNSGEEPVCWATELLRFTSQGIYSMFTAHSLGESVALEHRTGQSVDMNGWKESLGACSLKDNGNQAMQCRMIVSRRYYSSCQ